MKLSEKSIKIKELISGQVDMGTFGLVELILLEIEKQNKDEIIKAFEDGQINMNEREPTQGHLYYKWLRK